MQVCCNPHTQLLVLAGSINKTPDGRQRERERGKRRERDRQIKRETERERGRGDERGQRGSVGAVNADIK